MKACCKYSITCQPSHVLLTCSLTHHTVQVRKRPGERLAVSACMEMRILPEDERVPQRSLREQFLHVSGRVACTVGMPAQEP